MIFSQASTVRL